MRSFKARSSWIPSWRPTSSWKAIRAHEEALEIGKKSGADVIINMVLNRRVQLIDVFSGDLLRAHAKVVELLQGIVTIPIEREYEVVLTHGGYVGINHYQNAEAAVNALPVVKEKGHHPGRVRAGRGSHWGGRVYVRLHPGWKFTKDQWEPQMWAKVLDKMGEHGLIYCSSFLSRKEQEIVPGGVGCDYLPEQAYNDEVEQTREVVQNAIIYSVNHPQWGGAVPSVAFIKEEAYAVPVPIAPAAKT